MLDLIVTGGAPVHRVIRNGVIRIETSAAFFVFVSGEDCGEDCAARAT